MKSFCSDYYLPLLVFVLSLIAFVPTARAQKGVYVAGNIGMGYQLLEAQPALRIGGELKWMFLPYLGVALDATMQKPSTRPYAASLSDAVMSAKPPISFSSLTVDDLTGTCQAAIAFHPIAIANRESPHVFAMKLGLGVGYAYAQKWELTQSANMSNDYRYSEYFGVTAEFEISYQYQVYGPMYVGSQIGIVTMLAPYSLNPSYIYAGLAAGLRFGHLKQSAKPAEQTASEERL